MCQRYLVPDRDNIEESVRLLQEMGGAFEYDDFYAPAVLDDPEETQRRIAFYKALPRKREGDTLHGAFYDVNVASDDPRIREVSNLRMRQSMEIAERLGVRAVIFHTNCIAGFELKSYQDGWVERNAACYDRFLSAYPELEIYVENMFDQGPGLMARLLEALKDRKNFGACLDYGHAVLSGSPPEEWVSSIAPYIRHMHVNDNNGREDNHLAVGDGVTDWQAYVQLMEKYGIARRSPGVLLEMRGPQKQRRSMEYMKKKGCYPF